MPIKGLEKGDGVPSSPCGLRRDKLGKRERTFPEKVFPSSPSSLLTYTSTLAVHFPVALAGGFVEQNGGGSGDIQRVDLSQHGDIHLQICLFHPEIGQPGLFGTHHHRHRLGQVNITGLTTLPSFGLSFFSTRWPLSLPSPFSSLPNSVNLCVFQTVENT